MCINYYELLLIICIAIAPGAPVTDQDPIVLGAAQTEQKNSPCRKEFTKDFAGNCFPAIDYMLIMFYDTYVPGKLIH